MARCEWCGRPIYDNSGYVITYTNTIGSVTRSGLLCSKKCELELRAKNEISEEDAAINAGGAAGVAAMGRARRAAAPSPASEKTISCVFCGSKIKSGLNVCPVCNKDITTLVIPAGTTEIGPNAYRDKELVSLVIPEGVTAIGDDAFRENQLRSVTLPASLKSIGKWAFFNNLLQSVSLPDGLISIGDGAFKANNLNSLTLPGGLSLPQGDNLAFDYLFNDCYNANGRRAGTYTCHRWQEAGDWGYRWMSERDVAAAPASEAYKKGDYDAAIAGFDVVIRQYPDDWSMFNKRGNAYYAKDDYDKAIEDYSQAISLKGGGTDFIYCNRAYSYSYKGDYAKAIADYSQALRMDPKYVKALKGRAAAYRKQGKYAKFLLDTIRLSILKR